MTLVSFSDERKWVHWRRFGKNAGIQKSEHLMTICIFEICSFNWTLDWWKMDIFFFLNEFSFFKIDFRLRQYGPLTLDFLSTNFKCVLSMFLSLKIHQLITLKRILALRRTGTISNSLKIKHCWIRTTFFCKRIIERSRPPEWLPLNFND